jgi:RimJ/RimL family protein N-acetyltransferase
MIGNAIDRYALELADAPSWFETRDGRRLEVRLIQAGDAPRLLELFERLTPETRRRRFHYDPDHIPEERKQAIARHLADVDNRTLQGAVLAIDVDPAGREQIVGVARLARPADQPDAPVAEAAIVVRDDFQGCGVATELLWRMVLLAKQMKVDMILAQIEADNQIAIRAFRGLHLPTSITTAQGATDMYISVPE